MTKEELLVALAPLAEDAPTGGDCETDHSRADDLLIEYINDPDIKAAYDAVCKWYA